jgi:hypothetical protein
MATPAAICYDTDDIYYNKEENSWFHSSGLSLRIVPLAKKNLKRPRALFGFQDPKEWRKTPRYKIKIQCPLKYCDIYTGPVIQQMACRIIGPDAQDMPLAVKYVDQDDDGHTESKPNEPHKSELHPATVCIASQYLALSLMTFRAFLWSHRQTQTASYINISLPSQR